MSYKEKILKYESALVLENKRPHLLYRGLRKLGFKIIPFDFWNHWVAALVLGLINFCGLTFLAWVCFWFLQDYYPTTSFWQFYVNSASGVAVGASVGSAISAKTKLRNFGSWSAF